MEIKPLNYKELPGLSERQLGEHHDVLYAGYVNKLTQIRDTLGAVNKSMANSTHSEFRGLKIEEGFALDAIILHELYFENMSQNTSPSERVVSALAKRFGSFEDWKEDLLASGLSARGWVVLALDREDKLRHFLCDAHNQGGIWGIKPILVLDVYEHAYFIDYGTNRKKYIENFIENINWDIVEERLFAGKK